MMKKPLNFKVVLLGNSDVGKSTIVELLFGGKPRTVYTPTLEPKIRQYTVQNESGDINIKIFDCPGHQGYFDLHGQDIMPETNIAVIVYSAVDPASFLAIQYWLGQISLYLGVIPVIIVATKIDLAESGKKSPVIAKGMKIAGVFQKVLRLSELPFVEINATKPQSSLHVFNKTFSVLNSWTKLILDIQKAEKSPMALPVRTTPTYNVNIVFPAPTNQLEAFITSSVGEYNQKYPYHPITQPTVVALIEMIREEWRIKRVLEQLGQEKLMEILSSVAKDNRWLRKRSFLYLALYTDFYAQFGSLNLPTDELKPWAEKIAQFFVSTKDSLNHYWALSSSEQLAVLKKAHTMNMDMSEFKHEIYFHYRSLVYQSKI